MLVSLLQSILDQRPAGSERLAISLSTDMSKGRPSATIFIDPKPDAEVPTSVEQSRGNSFRVATAWGSRSMKMAVF